MRKAILLLFCFLFSICAWSIDKDTQDHKSEIEKAYGIKLPKIKNGYYKPVEHNHIPVYVKNEGIYFCDMNGNKVTDTYSEVGKEHNGYYVVKNSNGAGYIDTLFHQVVPCKYAFVATVPYNDITAVAIGPGKWKIIDMKDNILHDNLTKVLGFDTTYGAWHVAGPNGYGIINYKGEIDVPLKTDSVCSYDGYTAVVRNSAQRLAVYNCKKQSLVSDYEYDNCFPDTYNGIILLRKTLTGRWGILNMNGEVYENFSHKDPNALIPLYLYYIENPEHKASPDILERLRREADPNRNTFFLDDVIPDDIWNY